MNILDPVITGASTRRFLEMTKVSLLPIRKLPEVYSIGQVSWCFVLWLLKASRKLFRWFCGANMFAEMSPWILSEKLGI